MRLSLSIAALFALGVAANPIADPNRNWHNGGYADANKVFKFTSTWKVVGTPEQVVNGTTPTGGLPGNKGVYLFGIDSHTNTICYHITLYNFQGEYESPADTATHVHQGNKGMTGPPRIVFPDPVATKDPNVRTSVGCVTGPFKTGVIVNGADTGDGFDVKRIEENPKNYYADVHSSEAVPGANRGQFAC